MNTLLFVLNYKTKGKPQIHDNITATKSAEHEPPTVLWKRELLRISSGMFQQVQGKMWSLHFFSIRVLVQPTIERNAQTEVQTFSYFDTLLAVPFCI